MNKLKIILVVIILIAAVLRLYRLDQSPPSISWDEAAVGFNAYSVANFGKDEYGKIMPFFFRSFADDKHPVHIYATALSVKILGLNEFSTRLPSAVFGILNVILIYFLAKLLFKKEAIALAAAFFLSISPFNLHFSRFNHEANFVLFFLMLGLTLFFLFIRENERSSSLNKKVLPLSTLSFGICFITYHNAKILVPVIIITLLILYWRKIFQDKPGIFMSILILFIFGFVIFFNSQLLGFARVQQTSLGKERVKSTYLYQLSQSEFLGRLNIVAEQYTWHLSPTFLFISGDKNPRLSSQSTGEFHKIDALFLIAGLIFLVLKRSKEGILLLIWALFAPLPSSMVAEAPHAARASLMMGSWHLISALGFHAFFISLRKTIFKALFIVITILILLFSLGNYLKYYYGEYSSRYAIEWQYGMKQAVEFVKENPRYSQIFITDVRSQPYIFFLYYLKMPISQYASTVLYNNSESKSYNTVTSFEHTYLQDNKQIRSIYYFGGWDPIESFPNPGVLYILSPSQYDGLRYKSVFDVKRLIRYPNGQEAFYMVGLN